MAHTYRWLKADGVLVLVVPAVHVRECGEILASQFKDTRIFHLTDPESVRYRQVVVLGDTAEPPGARAVEGPRYCHAACSFRKHWGEL